MQDFFHAALTAALRAAGVRLDERDAAWQKKSGRGVILDRSDFNPGLVSVRALDYRTAVTSDV